MRASARSVLLAAVLGAAAACGDPQPTGWTGSVDTLSTGRVVVMNPSSPLWSSPLLEEELRIGTTAGEGPELFGEVRSIAVDREGRIYVVDGQAREVRAFAPDGTHLRSFGRPGAGPGELLGPAHVDIGPDGRVYVADPPNSRVTVYDTAGRYVAAHRVPGGFSMRPWPGGFDGRGRYYHPVPRPVPGEFRIALLRFDPSFGGADTMEVPVSPVKPSLELRLPRGVAWAPAPFEPRLEWRLSPAGTVWGTVTDAYRLFELSATGDTLRTVTLDCDPLPVVEADRERARADLEWFTDQGGVVDWAKVPSVKPAIEGLTVDAEGRIWTWPSLPADDEGTAMDVFDAVGRYLGRVPSPVPIARRPYPVIRDGRVYAVIESQLGVPFVVRLRLTGGRDAS